MNAKETSSTSPNYKQNKENDEDDSEGNFNIRVVNTRPTLGRPNSVTGARSLTSSRNRALTASQDWTFNLILCCVTCALSGSIQFGYNISSLNPIAHTIRSFIANETFLFSTYHIKASHYRTYESHITGNETLLNQLKNELEARKKNVTNCSAAVSLLTSSPSTIDTAFGNATSASCVDEFLKWTTKEEKKIEREMSDRAKLLKEKRDRLNRYHEPIVKAWRQVKKETEMLWTLLNCLFVVGGMLGALASKYVLDGLGRKRGILAVNTGLAVLGSGLMIVAYFTPSPIALIASRTAFGAQGGASCVLIPTYVNEISPSSLRGRTGLTHQIGIVLGILIAQLLSFVAEAWPGFWPLVVAAPPLFVTLIGSTLLVLLFPDSPVSLLGHYGDEEAARVALQLFRNRNSVDHELSAMLLANSKSPPPNGATKDREVSMKRLLCLIVAPLCRREQFDCCHEVFNNRERDEIPRPRFERLRWPLVVAIVLNAAQQLSGINAVSLFCQVIASLFQKNAFLKPWLRSDGNFELKSVLAFKMSAGLSNGAIQYAILGTGIVNLASTILCVPLIDRYGRRFLLIITLVLIVLDFVLLTICLALTPTAPQIDTVIKIANISTTTSTTTTTTSLAAAYADQTAFTWSHLFRLVTTPQYMSVVCIMLFIVCFAIGLGPVPFIFTAEVFPAEARSSAMALVTLVNWLACLLLTLAFPFLILLLRQFVFLLFGGLMLATLVLVVFKMLETKGKSVEEILTAYSGNNSKKKAEATSDQYINSS